MEVAEFRDRLYKVLCKAKKLKWATVTFERGNNQCLLVELVDGSKFQIIIVTTDRKI
jgi:hypothetical protein